MTTGNILPLLDNADVLVMLTWSDWFSELESNRYHYATRFAKMVPVIFVQPDLDGPTFKFEDTEISNVTVLHVFSSYTREQSELIRQALLQQAFVNPIFWVYNCHFHNFLQHQYAVLTIYHATEDYISSNSAVQFQDERLIHAYFATLRHCELIIAVSERIATNLKKALNHSKNILVETIEHLEDPNEKRDLQFDAVLKNINSELSKCKVEQVKLAILILYDPASTHIKTVHEYLSSYKRYSVHNVHYMPATKGLYCALDLNAFDVVVIHYSVRVAFPASNSMLSTTCIQAIKAFGGYKILYVQDEYDNTEITRQWITTLGIHTVYTCVPSQYIEQIYPKQRFPTVKFIQILTGYAPIQLPDISIKQTAERPILIGYRGRALPFWYGSLGQEKLQIGVEVKAYCQKKNLPVDIEWEEEKRIYSDDWYQFLANCRATLGTESGSNLFDFEGKIREIIEEKLAVNPDLTYQDVANELVVPNEIIQMNQISPKIFEAIYFRTALILFEGNYSGVLQPHIHFIPLRKDFSNLEEVLNKVQDDYLVNEMTTRAYQDIIESRLYSYQSFVKHFDEDLQKYIGKSTAYKDAISVCFKISHDSPEVTHARNTAILSDSIMSLAENQALSEVIQNQALTRFIQDEIPRQRFQNKVLLQVNKNFILRNIKKIVIIPVRKLAKAVSFKTDLF